MNELRFDPVTLDWAVADEPVGSHYVAEMDGVEVARVDTGTDDPETVARHAVRGRRATLLAFRMQALARVAESVVPEGGRDASLVDRIDAAMSGRAHMPTAVRLAFATAMADVIETARASELSLDAGVTVMPFEAPARGPVR